ncbi:LytTR family transcriptional regulator DNA-binding domain-containing protein, partial [Lactobacillus delbrueckii]|uniref:LytTR family transcriptional regulator DNA-binding domain-containing protein n=1 Tax=Lactobacillus delbrueckii TaxID=1584 RepID=UPI0022E23C3A
GVDSQNLPDVMVSVQFIFAIGENDFLLKVSQSCVINPDNVVSVDLAKRYVTFPNGDIVYFSRDKKKQIAALGEEQDQSR